MRKLFKERKLFKGGNYMRKYGTLAFVWQFYYCPNEPYIPRQLKTHIAFSMFPIVDTNLFLCHAMQKSPARLLSLFLVHGTIATKNYRQQPLHSQPGPCVYNLG